LAAAPLSFQLKAIPLSRFRRNGFVEFSVREYSEEEEGNSESTDCFPLFLRLNNDFKVRKGKKSVETSCLKSTSPHRSHLS
jgi:hypothetical protein